MKAGDLASLSAPALIGVIHLPALIGSPLHHMDWATLDARIDRDVAQLIDHGFDGIIVENFGDTPFFPAVVPPITVAAMTRCALRVADRIRRQSRPVQLGVNVLRNDGVGALSVASAAGADFVRINVHNGARVTDQGVVQGDAHRVVRLRREIEGMAAGKRLSLFCDVNVKHSAPLARREPSEEAKELVGRGLADAVLVTGAGTGVSATVQSVVDVAKASLGAPTYVASGIRAETISDLEWSADQAGGLPYGVIVGSALRVTGTAGDPIDGGRCRAFAQSWQARPLS